MQRAALALASLSLASCSEYEFVGKEDVDEVDNDTWTHTGGGDSVPQSDDCPNQVIPGYETSTDTDCENEAAVGTFTPVVEWSKMTWSTAADNFGIMSAPITASLTDDNGDGLIDENDLPDILAVTYSSASYSTGGTIRAVHGDGSGEIFSIAGQGIQGTGGVAAGDIDGDGMVEIISLTPSNVKAFEHDGTLKWSSPSISGNIYGVSDVAAISDMDADGNPEIIAGRAILNNNGNIVGVGTAGMGGVAGQNVGTASFAADLDGDGDQEVVVGNALYNRDGTACWTTSQQDGYPAVADFDGDGDAEIVVSGQGTVRLIANENGAVIWSQAIPGAGSPYYGGPPTIADYDGDGEPEIGLASGSRYSVFNADGSLLWQATTDDSSSGNTGSAVFDFEGDGAAEAVYADQTALWVFSGVDGSVKLRSTSHSNGTWLEYPIIADVDGDDHAEIVAVNTPQYGGYTGFHVFGDADNSWRPGRKIWNQHAYHITNVDDDGSIPSPADLNWLSYNNFRSGDMTAGDGFSAPDLTLAQGDICEIDCDENLLKVWVHAGNEGATDIIGTVTVSLSAVVGGTETLIDSVDISSGMTTGWYQDSIQFDISGYDPRTFASLVLRISGDELECDEDNNTLRWEGPFCGASD